MSTIAVPTSQFKNVRRGLVWLVPVAVLLALAVGWLAWRNWRGGAPTLLSAKYYTVVPMNLDVKVTKDGELQAINNIDIISLVEGQTAIQTLVKEGASVKKDDVLITLDSAQIKQKVEDTELDVQRADADFETAREMRDIQENQNAADLEAAEVNLALADLDLQQYTEGSYKQQVENAKTDKKMAEITLQNKEEDLQQTRNLFAKGFVTPADVKKGELDVTTAQNNLAKATTALQVLEAYTHQMDLKSKEAAVSQAKQRLARVKRNNASQLAQKEADLKAKKQALDMQQRRLAHNKEQLENCSIKAPADGMVVYVMSDWRSQTPVQEGATVRERQQLLRLPDTSAMKIVLRIQESQVSKLAEGQRATVKIVGVPNPVGATLVKIAVMADNSQRWWNPDLREYPIDLNLDETPPNLKPGMSAQAEIFIDRAEGVLAVPLESIYAAGQDSYLWVRQPDGQVDARKAIKATLGRTNETHVEVTTGLTEGQEVLLLQAGQGRELAEKAGIKAQPATKPSGGKKKGAPQGAPAAPVADRAAG